MSLRFLLWKRKKNRPFGRFSEALMMCSIFKLERVMGIEPT